MFSHLDTQTRLYYERQTRRKEAVDILIQLLLLKDKILKSMKDLNFSPQKYNELKGLLEQLTKEIEENIEFK
jgi:hypothetical protein